MLLKHIYKEHPPLRGSLDATKLGGDDITGTIKQAILHYHPDKQVRAWAPGVCGCAGKPCWGYEVEDCIGREFGSRFHHPGATCWGQGGRCAQGHPNGVTFIADITQESELNVHEETFCGKRPHTRGVARACADPAGLCNNVRVGQSVAVQSTHAMVVGRV